MTKRSVSLATTVFEAGKMFYRRIPYFVIASVSIYVGMVFVVIPAYYRFMPADWFLHVQGVPHIDNSTVDGPLTLTFCRETRSPSIEVVGGRSYYVLVNSKESPAGSYSFKATIEKSTHCQYISISAAHHPGIAGTYLSHTDLTFYIEGHRKVVSYDTNTFTLSDTRQTLEQQIEQLQKQIEQLKAQELQDDPGQTTVSTNNQQATATPSTSAAPTVAPTDTNRPSTVPPATTPPIQSARPTMPVQEILSVLTGGLL